jgi:hypothetical protein
MSRPAKLIVLLLAYVSTAAQMYSMGRQSAWHECHVETMARYESMSKDFANLQVQP